MSSTLATTMRPILGTFSLALLLGVGSLQAAETTAPVTTKPAASAADLQQEEESSSALKGLEAAKAESEKEWDAYRAKAVDSPVVGQYVGTLISEKGEASEAEMTLDHYKCFVLRVKKDTTRMELGRYEVQGDTVVLKTNEGKAYRWFSTKTPDRLELLGDEGKPLEKKPEGCCTLIKS
ncbi:hypothetical protein [Sutterella megalosphaeroides]|uniref:Lysozyme inhibitor n=1 Tax=Sutterella megalosphaeroides TaxID=2494234 RepID=A0A2Z6IA70_9BURK|nr:hypothetical protein [Sutterella megalosphaeroides]BBF23272.1 hypothetical protein SUTMEG_11630 [Sutterella megalosphaeroides]